MTRCPRCQRTFDEGVRFCPVDGAQVLDSVEDPNLGKTLLGQFEVRDLCGRGAMGTVYRAYQRTMDRVVAVKILRRELLKEHEVVRRFLREARAAARLTHPNIVTVHLVGETDDGAPFLVMEYVDGVSLENVCEAQGAQPLARVVSLGKQMAAALAEAHAAGIVHRDLKPANILITDRARVPDLVKVLDFGIAKIVSGADQSLLTRDGVIFGTPHYIAPEQATGGDVDARADIYSLGVILFRLATGALPFEGTQGMQVVLKHLREAPPRPSTIEPRVSAALEELILSCLQKDCSQRPSDADALVAALDRVAASAPPDGTMMGVTPPVPLQPAVGLPQGTLSGSPTAATLRPEDKPARPPSGGASTAEPSLARTVSPFATPARGASPAAGTRDGNASPIRTAAASAAAASTTAGRPVAGASAARPAAPARAASASPATRAAAQAARAAATETPARGSGTRAPGNPALRKIESKRAGRPGIESTGRVRAVAGGAWWARRSVWGGALAAIAFGAGAGVLAAWLHKPPMVAPEPALPMAAPSVPLIAPPAVALPPIDPIPAPTVALPATPPRPSSEDGEAREKRRHRHAAEEMPMTVVPADAPAPPPPRRLAAGAGTASRTSSPASPFPDSPAPPTAAPSNTVRTVVDHPKPINRPAEPSTMPDDCPPPPSADPTTIPLPSAE